MPVPGEGERADRDHDRGAGRDVELAVAEPVHGPMVGQYHPPWR